jgi:hypothetical protein
MANSTFDLFTTKTVLSTYSWDQGLPNDPGKVTLVSALCSETNQHAQYTGYAPYVFVSLSSAPGDLREETILLMRTVNYGDYYNSDSNYTAVPTLSYETFCHTYVMPGTYTIEFKSIEYYVKFKNKTSEGIYVQNAAKTLVNPLSSQWDNFTCDKSNVRWNTSGFQQANQLTWRDTTGPCITPRTEWSWDENTCAVLGATWDETKSDHLTRATWNYVVSACHEGIDPELGSITDMQTKTAIINVIEIPPTAYLDITQPEDRYSPLEVRLSAKNTICGSFPIEKIVWDLGDGSPLLVQRRWSNTLDVPFVYTDNLTDDFQDPRNYDVIHTYTKTPSSGFCFYPSITAYASSTNTSNCAAAIVGPLRLPSNDGTNVKIIQTELTDYGKVMIGQVAEELAVWQMNK